MTIRVLLADDHTLLRKGLAEILENEEDIEVVAEVGDGLEAIVAARSSVPHVVVMDVSMPGMNGIEATRRIARDLPDVHVLCLSMHAERRYVCEVLLAGASGYMLKDAAPGELVRAVRSLAAGCKYVSPSITGIVLDALSGVGTDAVDDSLALLTDREREVLQLLAEGHTTKRIALRLEVSAKTVATHRENVMRKLEIDSIAGLTKYAIRHGLTSVDRAPPS